MKRLDIWLIDLQLAPSRAKAQELIEEGSIRIQISGVWKVVDQASKKFASLSPDQVEIASAELLKYVARSGLKLEHALSRLELKVEGMNCLDIGQSTGGFTDCLLQHGARQVVGIDVGSGQVDQRIRSHPHVQVIENLHAKDLSTHPDLRLSIGQFDLAVVDVSFISVTKVFAEIFQFVRSGGHFLVLIKPQFELGAQALNKRGVVDSLELLAELEQSIRHYMKSFGLSESQYFASEIKGRDGNQEFFFYAQKI